MTTPAPECAAPTSPVPAAMDALLVAVADDTIGAIVKGLNQVKAASPSECAPGLAMAIEFCQAMREGR